MHCFNHPDKAAIGICKSCQRGLCNDCAADLGHALACKHKHEQEVETLKFILNRSVKIYTAMPKAGYLSPVFYLVTGLIFIWFGYSGEESLINLPFIMGSGFVIFAIATYLYHKQISAQTKPPTQT